MQVLHFGTLHEESCVELSTTNDWAPVEDISDETLDALDVQECPICQE